MSESNVFGFIRKNGDEPLGRAELDAELAKLEGCSCPAHDRSLALKASCHPKSGLCAYYGGGRFVIRCKACDSFVLALWVGEAPPS